MKYIKVTGDMLWGKDKLTKQDLAEAETIINLENLTMFFKEDNKWEDIPHD